MRRQRVAHASDARERRQYVADRLRADVAGERRCRCARARSGSRSPRRAAVHAVAEAQHRVAVVLGFDDELGAPRHRSQADRAARSSGAGRLRCARRSPAARRPRRIAAPRSPRHRCRPAPFRRCRRCARGPAASAARPRCGRADSAARGRRAAASRSSARGAVRPWSASATLPARAGHVGVQHAADALRQAQRERQRVAIGPCDLDEGLIRDRIAPHRRHAAHAGGERRLRIDARQPHRVALQAVGIDAFAGASCSRALRGPARRRYAGAAGSRRRRAGTRVVAPFGRQHSSSLQVWKPHRRCARV